MEIRVMKFWKAMNESCVTNAEFPFSKEEPNWTLFAVSRRFQCRSKKVTAYPVFLR